LNQANSKGKGEKSSTMMGSINSETVQGRKKRKRGRRTVAGGNQGKGAGGEHRERGESNTKSSKDPI